VETVRVEVPVPFAERLTADGLSDAVGLSRDIDPVVAAVRVRFPENPLRLVSRIVDVPEEPSGMLRLLGLAETAKSGGDVTLSPTFTECDMEPLVPVTVTV